MTILATVGMITLIMLIITGLVIIFDKLDQ